MLLLASPIALPGRRGTVESARCSGSTEPNREQSEALPEVLRGSPSLAVTIGALIRYIDSPVGPYREIIAVPAFVRRPFPQANVAFIAVDSEASVVGGRSNWALPKVLARFEGTIGLQGDATVVGPDWMVPVARGLGRCGCRPGYATPAVSCGQI